MKALKKKKTKKKSKKEENETKKLFEKNYSEEIEKFLENPNVDNIRNNLSFMVSLYQELTKNYSDESIDEFYLFTFFSYHFLKNNPENLFSKLFLGYARLYIKNKVYPKGLAVMSHFALPDKEKKIFSMNECKDKFRKTINLFKNPHVLSKLEINPQYYLSNDYSIDLFLLFLECFVHEINGAELENFYSFVKANQETISSIISTEALAKQIFNDKCRSGRIFKIYSIFGVKFISKANPEPSLTKFRTVNLELLINIFSLAFGMIFNKEFTKDKNYEEAVFNYISGVVYKLCLIFQENLYKNVSNFASFATPVLNYMIERISLLEKHCVDFIYSEEKENILDQFFLAANKINFIFVKLNLFKEMEIYSGKLQEISEFYNISPKHLLSMNTNHFLYQYELYKNENLPGCQFCDILISHTKTLISLFKKIKEGLSDMDQFKRSEITSNLTLFFRSISYFFKEEIVHILKRGGIVNEKSEYMKALHYFVSEESTLKNFPLLKHDDFISVYLDIFHFVLEDNEEYFNENYIKTMFQNLDHDFYYLKMTANILIGQKNYAKLNKLIKAISNIDSKPNLLFPIYECIYNGFNNMGENEEDKINFLLDSFSLLTDYIYNNQTKLTISTLNANELLIRSILLLVRNNLQKFINALFRDILNGGDPIKDSNNVNKNILKNGIKYTVNFIKTSRTYVNLLTKTRVANSLNKSSDIFMSFFLLRMLRDKSPKFCYYYSKDNFINDIGAELKGELEPHYMYYHFLSLTKYNLNEKIEKLYENKLKYFNFDFTILINLINRIQYETNHILKEMKNEKAKEEWMIKEMNKPKLNDIFDDGDVQMEEVSKKPNSKTSKEKENENSLQIKKKYIDFDDLIQTNTNFNLENVVLCLLNKGINLYCYQPNKKVSNIVLLYDVINIFEYFKLFLLSENDSLQARLGEISLYHFEKLMSFYKENQSEKFDNDGFEKFLIVLFYDYINYNPNYDEYLLKELPNFDFDTLFIQSTQPNKNEFKFLIFNFYISAFTNLFLHKMDLPKSNPISKLKDKVLTSLKEYREDLEKEDKKMRFMKSILYIEIKYMQFLLNFDTEEFVLNKILKGIELINDLFQFIINLVKEKGKISFHNKYLPIITNKISEFFHDKDSVINSGIIFAHFFDYGFFLIKAYNMIKKLCKIVFPLAIKYKFSDDVFRVISRVGYLRFFLLYDQKFCIFILKYLIKTLKKYNLKLERQVNVSVRDLPLHIYQKFENSLIAKYLYLNGLIGGNLYANLKEGKENIRSLVEKKLLNEENLDYIVSKHLKINYLKNPLESSDKEKANYIKIKLFDSNNESDNYIKKLFENLFEIKSEQVIPFFLQNITNINEKYKIKLIPLVYKEFFGPDFFKQNMPKIQEMLHSFQIYIINNGFNMKTFSSLKYMSKLVSNFILNLEELSMTEENTVLLKFYINNLLNFESNMIIRNKTEKLGDFPFNYISFFRIKSYLFFCIEYRGNFVYSSVKNSKEINQMNMHFSQNTHNNAMTTYVEPQELHFRTGMLIQYIFNLQDLFINTNTGIKNMIKKIILDNKKFTEYLDSKIQKYSSDFDMCKDEMLEWLFTSSNNILPIMRNHGNAPMKQNPKTKDNYQKKFIRKIYFSNKFAFNFYSLMSNNIFYYLTSGEYSKIPIENLPILYHFPIFRTYTPLYLRMNLADNFIPLAKKDIFYLLNPGNDLPDSEKELGKFYKEKGIKGMSGKDNPTFEKLKPELLKCKLFIYDGHGDCTQYIPYEYTTSNPINYMVMLFGCSSAQNKIITGKDNCKISLPNYYMANGCPLFLGFLWKVTSKDVDEFTKAIVSNMFSNLGSEMSLIDCIIRAKKCLTRRYYNGIAAVVYANRDVLLSTENL